MNSEREGKGDAGEEKGEEGAGEGWLDMARYTPVALDEDGDRELRELKALLLC